MQKEYSNSQITDQFMLFIVSIWR